MVKDPKTGKQVHRPDEITLLNVLKGNSFFRSTNLENGHHHSRRDDLIGALYMAIFFINGFKFVIQHIGGRLSEIFKKVTKLRGENSAKIFCKIAQTEYLTEALEYVYYLGYDEQPNYQKLKFMLTKILLNFGQNPKTKFSWISGN